MNDDEIVQIACQWCGNFFEDYNAAYEQHGGWCPYCDAPAGRTHRDPSEGTWPGVPETGTPGS
jgi:hypothetical protein